MSCSTQEPAHKRAPRTTVYPRGPAGTRGGIRARACAWVQTWRGCATCTHPNTCPCSRPPRPDSEMDQNNSLFSMPARTEGSRLTPGKKGAPAERGHTAQMGRAVGRRGELSPCWPRCVRSAQSPARSLHTLPVPKSHSRDKVLICLTFGHTSWAEKMTSRDEASVATGSGSF